jgi:hypothetical protein
VVPLGKARMHREGRDLTIVTYGMMVHKSAEAAEVLEEDGLEVEILDLRTLLPLDEDAIVESVKKTSRLLVVHEDTRTGGIAGEIAMRVNEKAFEWLDAPILRHRHRRPGAVLAAARGLLPAAGGRHGEGGAVPGELLTNSTSRSGADHGASKSRCPRWASPSPRAPFPKWLKKVGDRVERDEPILEISTDKVDAEIPSPPWPAPSPRWW